MNYTKSKEIIPNQNQNQKQNLNQKQNYYSIPSNRSPPPFNKLKNNLHLRSFERSPIPVNITKNFEVEENLEENININDYLNSKQINFYQSKNRFKGRSPENVHKINKIQNNNYYNFNRNYYNDNYNPNIIKHFESDDFDDNNNNKQENNNYNKNKNLKKKILEIKQQNSEEYEQYINKNYNNNNIYNYNNFYNGNYYNNNYNEIKEKRTKKYDKYENYRNYNKNKNKNKKREQYNNNTNHSKDHYLCDINNNKNQTQENYYKNKYKKYAQNNNDSSSSNIYDESYDYKTQYNFKKTQKNKYREFPKFYSASSQENSYSDANKEEEAFNTTQFRPPLKNDEEHYHQNLTIKTKNPFDDKKNKKIRLNINNIDNENLANFTQQFKDKNKSYIETKTNIEFPNLNKNNNKKINTNKSPENINKKIYEEKKKKIKEITVDLSPKKKLNLSNSNQNLGSRINRINNMTASNTFNINPNSKIESCIIKFEKNDKNDNKNKLSNSLDRFDLNKVRYIKKKIITRYTIKNSPIVDHTPGNNFNSPYNLTNSAKKMYPKPMEKKPNSPQEFYTPLENLEMSGEVKDYCAPSPNYGKKGKEAYLNAQKNKNNLNNNSPLLTSSGKFQIFESNKKDNNSPYYNKKYDEFSFREKNCDINDVNYSNGQKVEVNIINNDINSNNEKDNNKIKNKNKANENFTIFTQQRMPTFSNMEVVNKNENNEINKDNKDIKDNKEISEPKLVIKSFSNKQKEIKEKPILTYNFYKKYYDIYISLPQKENILMTKLNPIEKEKSYEERDNKNINNKLINASIRRKLMEVSANNFFIRNELNSSLNDEHYLNLNNTVDIELDNNNNTAKKIGNKITIRTVIKKIKRKKNLEKKNFAKKNNNIININELLKKEIKTKEQIKKEKKVNSILKEDFENFIIFYNLNKKNKKYDYSMIELLMIKIKLNIAEIIKAYLKSCEDIITDNKYINIGNIYIKNIIQHYMNNYLTNENFDEIHKKIIILFANIKEINIDINFKYQILMGLINILLNDELFFLNDFDILKQTDDDNKNNIKKILENCEDKAILEKINF